MVQDQGQPQKFNSSTLTLDVQNNFNRPRFDETYSITILENRDISTELFNLTAIDNDLVGLRFDFDTLPNDKMSKFNVVAEDKYTVAQMINSVS